MDVFQFFRNRNPSTRLLVTINLPAIDHVSSNRPPTSEKKPRLRSELQAAVPSTAPAIGMPVSPVALFFAGLFVWRPKANLLSLKKRSELAAFRAEQLEFSRFVELRSSKSRQTDQSKAAKSCSAGQQVVFKRDKPRLSRNCSG